MNRTDRTILMSAFILSCLVNLSRTFTYVLGTGFIASGNDSLVLLMGRYLLFFAYAAVVIRLNLMAFRRRTPFIGIKEMASSLVLNSIGILVVTMIYNRLRMQYFPIEFDRIDKLVRYTALAHFFMVHFASFLLAYVFILSIERNQVLLDQERLKAENAEFKLRTMKVQLNPHFLFNALNTLVSLIRTQQEKAILYVQHLSSVLRYVLSTSEMNTISLAEELRALEAYLAIQEIKYGERIRVHIDLPMSEFQKKIPPMTLQLLVENALKHNESTLSDPLDIRLSFHQSMLWVSNSYRPKKVMQPSTGKGLTLLVEQYKVLFESVPELIKTEEKFIVKLPLN